jgi:hypothetical protein
MSVNKNSEADHRKYQEMVDGGLVESLQRTIVAGEFMLQDTGMTEIAIEEMENDLKFAFNYLRKMRKEVIEGVFKSLKSGQPAILALVDVLGAVGVKSADIDGAFGMNTSAVKGILLPASATASMSATHRPGGEEK